MPWNNQGGGGDDGGPWGNPGGGGRGGGGNGGSPWGQGGGGSPQDIDKVVRQGREALGRMLPSGGKSLSLLLIVAIAIWALTGFYRVNPQQQGVVLRFGEWVRTTAPGLHYHIPYPIEAVMTPEVTRDNRIEIGFRDVSGNSSSRRDIADESQMITGDENIVDIDFVVFWRISDAGQYLFNLAEPDDTIKVAAEAVMRELDFFQSFVFKYSPRPNTPSERRMEGDVPKADKDRRCNELLAIQNELSQRHNERYVGAEMEVLIDGPSRKDSARWSGRTRLNRVLHFPAPAGDRRGELATARVERVSAHALYGELLT